MKLTRKLRVVLALALVTAVAGAADYPMDYNPAFRDGALWTRKSGTTNTKQDLESTDGALHVQISGSIATSEVEVKIPGAAATVDTSFTAQTADFTIEAATANLRILGWSVREDAGTPAVATVVIRHDADGTCDGGAVVAFIELDADQSSSMNYGDRGLAVPSGLCADVLAGSVSLAAHLIAEAAP